jgi:D-3-phosphoglycerate dehydrogenase / 2-oxoglutarate reductase
MANKKKVVFIDSIFPDVNIEKSILEPLNVELINKNCKNIKEIIEIANDAVAIMTTVFKPVGEEIFASCPSLKLVIRTGIGFDTIDVDAATKHDIYVCNVPEFCIQEVSDHTVALLLNLSRKITIANARMKGGEFSYYDYLKPITRLQGKTVGFLGFGKIARLVALKLNPFGLKMNFFDPYVNQKNNYNIIKVSFKEIFQKSDFLCIHLPETEKTYHLINRDTLSLMKPTAYIINTSRGGIIDNSALIESLSLGKLGGAALDVAENETTLCPENALCQMENVILTPHAAWYSEDSIDELRKSAASQVALFIKGEPLTSLVNPEVLKKQ